MLSAVRRAWLWAQSSLRDGPQYTMLDGAREKSYYYYTRTSRRTWYIACAGAALVLLYFAAGAPLPATYHRPFLASDGYSCAHPVTRLAYDAETNFNQTLDRQSQSLEDAVTEYQRRYGMPPPPNFDKWYEFAKARGTVLIDEFDTIYHALLPFWGLAPSTIRERVREDLGFDNHQMTITVQNGKAKHIGNFQGEFQRDATMKILDMCAQWLPDMHLPFNIHDEPRIVIPHEDLHRMVVEGKAAQARLRANAESTTSFSKTKLEEITPVQRTRFNDIELQETWLFSRLSCPPDSPARALDNNAKDNSTTWASAPLGFVYNQTASTDMCLSPSLRHKLGVFERPNAFKISTDLTPMFSMSRPSSFQDIVMPSPLLLRLYWRGSTKGGHSRGGSWKSLQRQRVIGNLTHPESQRHFLTRTPNTRCAGRDSGWDLIPANASQLNAYVNTYFTGIEDCDEDCLDEELYFEVVDKENQDAAWKYRYLLDMDGHAYSGRFYAFMRSPSVPFKLTFFREWHENALWPWVHYVPLNKDADEIPELLRFFEEDVEGRSLARRIGLGGQDWAGKALRNEDMEVYFFRLLLEYARVQDDERESLGYYVRDNFV
ncbi:hypothetical protein N7532_010534 [Penicillium argentinense]|uniref:Glycosyl transferase CAP10 domain-containing protein n=1 Tax=Penicillium argentinense TaxID=1131581 RepID=A0A9W9EPS3_9EURO|nr:uncharacterized protein N7532_010534 [Penicillium argentinense]KAJ5085763.1 hypothetical protein N7532_010534 [Penicillium argentinense]